MGPRACVCVCVWHCNVLSEAMVDCVTHNALLHGVQACVFGDHADSPHEESRSAGIHLYFLHPTARAGTISSPSYAVVTAHLTQRCRQPLSFSRSTTHTHTHIRCCQLCFVWCDPGSCSSPLPKYVSRPAYATTATATATATAGVVMLLLTRRCRRRHYHC